MKKSGAEYASEVLSVFFCAAVLACAAVAYAYGYYAAGALLSVAFCLLLWFCAGYLRLKRLETAFDGFLKEKKPDEAERCAREISGSKLFYPIMRFTGLRVMLVVYMFRDETDEAERTIVKIRHNGGAGWKYRTAYYYILILLDREELTAARAEYEEFLLHNRNVAFYKEQIETLEALFARLFSTADKPLPASVLDSLYPVVHRILGRHFEAQAAASADWN